MSAHARGHEVATRADEASAVRRSAAELGTWLFLAQEVLFFGGLFLAWVVYRQQHPSAFAAGSALLELPWGTLNTAVLLVSSLCMALAVRAREGDDARAARRWLAATAGLGLVFLGVKAGEYHHAVGASLLPGATFRVPEGVTADAGPLQLFFSLYFLMTGLHALHLLVGVGLVAWLFSRMRGEAGPSTALVVGVGLYWHFVDVVWLYLFPCLYLVSPR